jgi:hypothetical protein
LCKQRCTFIDSGSNSSKNACGFHFDFLNKRV